jgi:ketopantoate reductase
MAKKPVVVIGMGEMGSVFARGLLRLGHPVYPLGRDGNMKKLARGLPAPGMVLVAVGEAELAGVLEAIPKTWRGRIALLQNELLPADYRQFDDVTVISVWFEKKKGQDAKVVIPSPAYGPRAKLLVRALGTLGIPVRQLERPRDLLFELVLKNLYILTSNIAGLRTGGTVSELWANHRPFAREVAREVIRLQEGLTGARFDHDRLIAAMVKAFEGDPDHRCTGRSAPARLARAMKHADQLGIELPTLRAIAAEQAQRGHA